MIAVGYTSDNKKNKTDLLDTHKKASEITG